MTRYLCCFLINSNNETIWCVATLSCYKVTSPEAFPGAAAFESALIMGFLAPPATMVAGAGADCIICPPKKPVAIAQPTAEPEPALSKTDCNAFPCPVIIT